MTYDFIVVGSGSVGSAAGYYAARAGLKVLMIDDGHPPHDQGSHHGETRLMRHAYGEAEFYVPMVLRAQALWDDLQTKTDDEIFSPTGILYICPEESAFLAGVKASAAKWDIRTEAMHVQAAMDRWPQINVPDGFVALHEPDAGVLRSESAVRTYLELARASGADQTFGHPVISVVSDANGVTVCTKDNEWRAKKGLISAGTWATRIVPELPVTPVRKVFTWHETDRRYDRQDGFPGFVSATPEGHLFYGFPAENGVLKVAQHTGGQVIGSPEERLPFGAVDSDTSEVAGFLNRILPGVGAIGHGASCTYDNSPDEDFIIDTLPGQPNVMVVAGLSGHGFKYSSVLGEIASDFAQNKAAEFDLTPFRLSRFQPSAST